MRTCKHCGEEFIPKRKEQLYCCHKCSVAFTRKNKFDFGHVPWISR